MTKKEKAMQITKILIEEYPDAVCSLDYTNDYELLIAGRLSAQCTDKRVITSYSIHYTKLYDCDEELNEQDMSLVDSKVAIQQDTENKTASIYSDYKKIGEYLLKTEAVDEITIGTVATKIP